MAVNLESLNSGQPSDLPFEASVLFQLKDLKKEGYTGFKYEEEPAKMNGKTGRLLKVVMMKRGQKFQTKPIFVHKKKDYKEIKRVLKKCVKYYD